jgi:uncharacterized membrane protein YccC
MSVYYNRLNYQEDSMTIRDIINRGNNLAITAIIAISGIAFFPEFFTEAEPTHKLDEGLLLLLAIAAVVWYLVGKNRYSHSFVPIIFSVLALIFKGLGLYLEFGDLIDRGDEFGALLLFILTIALSIWLYTSARRMAEKAEAAEPVAVAKR